MSFFQFASFVPLSVLAVPKVFSYGRRRKMLVTTAVYEYTFIIVQKRMRCKAVPRGKRKEELQFSWMNCNKEGGIDLAGR